MILSVFTYGSLIDEPEHPDRVRERRLAVWPDHDRVFHLRSTYRGCPTARAAFPDLVVPDFLRNDHRDSLVLGTRARTGHRLPGALLTFDDPDGQTLATIDRREGFDPEDPEGSPYHRVSTTVEVGSVAREAWVYVTNPRHPRVVELSVQQQADVLLAASPRKPPEVHDRPRGAQYLLPLVRFLREHDRHDVGLESLVSAMRSRIGPVEDHPYLWTGKGLGTDFRP